MTAAQLKRQVTTWSKRLRALRGWKIAIRYATKDELAEWLTSKAGTKCYGREDHDRNAMTATILLRHPDEYGDMEPCALEEVIVHELLHIIESIGKEPSINIIAEALCAAYRRKR